jgi:glyoxylase-like metal-dependent hydrolase (beta-lactamase superfamily II)
MTAAHEGLTRLEIGDAVVTYLPDGHLGLDHRAAFPESAEEMWDEHRDELFALEGWLLLSVGAVLVETSDHTVLVDLGVGPNDPDRPANPRVGRGELLRSLAAAGSSPARVDDVVFTHLHRDHIGWVSADRDSSTPTFPRARYHVARAEWAYWTAAERAGDRDGPRAAQVRTMSSDLVLMEDGASITPVVSTLPTPGHTPGHTCVVIEDHARRAIVVGDAVHCPLELTHQDLTFHFDLDPALARRSRAKLRAELRKPDTWYFGTHFPQPLVGRLD